MSSYLEWRGLFFDPGAGVQHHEAKFVKIMPELKGQEPFVTENTCKNIN